MKVVWSFLLLIISCQVAIGQEYKLNLLSQWNNEALRQTPNLAPLGQRYNDIWGWTDPNGTEYVILGSIDSTYFIDISDPRKPIVRDVEAGAAPICIHRDYKTRGNYCYAVADEGASTLQVFDMSYLPDSVHKVYDSDFETRKTHNIFIWEDKLFLASNSHTQWGFIPLTGLELLNPERPKSIHHITAPKIDREPMFTHVHDIFVRDGIAFMSNGDDGLFIYDYNKDFRNPELLSIITNYPDQGYNHSSWLSDDSKYLVFADETHGTRLKIYDVSNVKSPKFMSTFHSGADSGSIPHNPFIAGDLCFVSYYHEGLQIFDISDPENVERVDFYDTYPQNQDMSFEGTRGCWGVYPFFPSGTIVASDMLNGLFVFELEGWETPYKVDVPKPVQKIENIRIGQTRSSVTLYFDTLFEGAIDISLVDMKGRTVYHYEGTTEPVLQVEVPVNQQRSGAYLLVGSVGDFYVKEKLILLHE